MYQLNTSNCAKTGAYNKWAWLTENDFYGQPVESIPDGERTQIIDTDTGAVVYDGTWKDAIEPDRT